MNKEITQSINKLKYNSLYENISKLEDKENLIILDFFHMDLNFNKNSDEEEKYFMRQSENLKDISNLDKKIYYILFCKEWMMDRIFNSEKEEIKSNKKVNELRDFLAKSENIFIEDKLTNIHFIIGFSIAKNITTFIFRDNLNLNSNWLKPLDSSFKNKLKISEFEFFKITLNYMQKEKKRKNEEVYGKQPSKLSGLFDENVRNSTTHEIDNNKAVTTTLYKNEVKNSSNFHLLVRDSSKYILHSNPKNFQTIKNILANFSEQNIHLFKGFNTNEKELSFLILSELISSNIIKNKILADLIQEGKINSLNEIEEIISFEVNMDNTEIENTMHITDKKKRKRDKLSSNDFYISETAEEEYKRLIIDCPAICIYAKKIIFKVLSSIGFETISKLPTNPSKYKNLIYSYINNQELKKIANKILNLDYEKIVNILTDGIIIEFMRNNLIVFLSDRKIYYNIQEIEKEKFRLIPNTVNKI